MDGEVAERLKAAASKAVEVIFASVSSNLTLSARKIDFINFHRWLMAIGLWLNSTYSQWLKANSQRYFVPTKSRRDVRAG
jgi:hypothetical protein